MLEKHTYLRLENTVRIVSGSANTMHNISPICRENTLPYFETNLEIVSCGFSSLMKNKYPNIGTFFANFCEIFTQSYSFSTNFQEFLIETKIGSEKFDVRFFKFRKIRLSLFC